MVKKAPKKLLENEVYADVWKFYMAMRAYPKTDFMTVEYITEKLMQILQRNSNWHCRINEAWKEFKEK